MYRSYTDTKCKFTKVLKIRLLSSHGHHTRCLLAAECRQLSTVTALLRDPLWMRLPPCLRYGRSVSKHREPWCFRGLQKETQSMSKALLLQLLCEFSCSKFSEVIKLPRQRVGQVKVGDADSEARWNRRQNLIQPPLRAHVGLGFGITTLHGK